MKNGPSRGHFFLVENTSGIIGRAPVFIVRFEKVQVLQEMIWSVYIFTGAMFINFVR